MIHVTDITKSHHATDLTWCIQRLYRREQNRKDWKVAHTQQEDMQTPGDSRDELLRLGL